MVVVMVDYVFVYGTLKFNKLMERLGCKRVGEATTVNDYLLVIDNYRIPYIIPINKVPEKLKSKATKIKGIVYELPKIEEARKFALNCLDKYEGVRANFYNRIVTKVKLNNDGELDAYVYVPSKITTDKLLELIDLKLVEIEESGCYYG